METLTLLEFQTRLGQQKVPRRHLAFTCVMCGTIQSMESLIRAGAGATEDEVEKYIGFSCVGRFTDAGPHQPGTPPGRGCKWTLGGLLQLHKLEVVDPEGKRHPHFQPATPEEAQALMRSWTAPAPSEGGAACPTV